MENQANEKEEFGKREYTTIAKNKIQSLLRHKLGSKYLSTRSGPGGTKLTYIEGWQSIEIANDVFGYNGWSDSICELNVDFCDFDRGKWNVGVSAIVKVMLQDGTYHEDIGYGDACLPSRSLALGKAKKAAVTDARKRALRLFGNILGNCVYDKSHIAQTKRDPNNGKLLESASSISNANEYTLIEDKPPESRESTSKEEESPSTAQNKKEEESGPSPPTHTIPTSGPLQPPPESASAPKGSLLNPIVINATDPTEPTPLPPTESKEPTSSPPVPAEGPPVEVAPALSAPTETPLTSAPIHVQMNHTPLTTASPVVTTVPPAPLPSYGETQPRPGNSSYMVSTTPSSSTSSLTVASPQVHQNRPNAGLPRPLNSPAPSTTMNGLNTGSPSAVNHPPYTNPMKPVASPVMNGPINKNPMNAMPTHNYAMNKNYNAMPNNMMVKNEPPKNVMPNRLPTPNYPAPPPSPLPGANGPVSTYQRSASSPRQSPNYNQPAPYTAPATTPKPYGAPSAPTSTVPLPGGQSLPPHYLSSNSPATGKTLPPVPVVKNYPPPNNINYNNTYGPYPNQNNKRVPMNNPPMAKRMN